MIEKFYEASPLKRNRRTNTQLEQIDKQIYAVLVADHPQSVRHIFYRLTDPRLPEPVDKSDKGYELVQRRCVQMRRDGRLKYAWIADMSRRGYFTSTFADASDFIRRMAGLYRADLWASSDYRCEVWTESRSIASVIQDDCEELAVDLYPCGGFSSLSFAHYAAEQHNHSGDDKPLVIYYIGDYDPAGVLIDRALERELRLHLRDSIDMNFVRIAINKEQIQAFDLPTKPRKKTDTRSRQIESTVEAEAMPAHVLRELLRRRVEALLPEGAIEAAKVAEKSEQKGLRLIAERVGGKHD